VKKRSWECARGIKPFKLYRAQTPRWGHTKEVEKKKAKKQTKTQTKKQKQFISIKESVRAENSWGDNENVGRAKRGVISRKTLCRSAKAKKEGKPKTYQQKRACLVVRKRRTRKKGRQKSTASKKKEKRTRTSGSLTTFNTPQY